MGHSESEIFRNQRLKSKKMKSFFRDDELEFWSNHLVEWQIVWAKDPKDRNKSDIKEKLWTFLWLPISRESFF